MYKVYKNDDGEYCITNGIAMHFICSGGGWDEEGMRSHLTAQFHTAVAIGFIENLYHTKSLNKAKAFVKMHKIMG